MDKDNILVVDSTGVLHDGRDGLENQYKARYSRNTEARDLKDAVKDTDIFLGVSQGGVLTKDMIKSMAGQPLIMALANPDPEIRPEDAKEVRPDAILATGRTDYPNQVNNVLCFPFIFRGALDVGATAINDDMKMACVRALANLAKAETDETVVKAYGLRELSFGPDYLIPKPFDPRLLVEIAPAVAKAAMDTGVATRPIENFEAYRQQLSNFTFHSGMAMRPILEQAKKDPKRVVFAEGESSRTLRAVQNALDEGFVEPILVGRRSVVELRLQQLGLRLKIDEDFELCDPEHDDRYRDYWKLYHEITCRKGISVNEAKMIVRTNTTVIAALMVKQGEADALLCGVQSAYVDHLPHLFSIIGIRKDVERAAALSMMILPKKTVFICDSYVNPGPTAEQIAGYTLLAAETIRRFGIEPKVALLSHSNFGSSNRPQVRKMREAVDFILKQDPSLEVDGEMHADVALSEEMREPLIEHSNLTGSANLLVMPSLDAANISYNMVRMLAECVTVGPILLGMTQPAHILRETVTTRGIYNMIALAVVEAQEASDGILPF